MGEGKRRKQHRREQGLPEPSLTVLAGKYFPANPVITTMAADDLFSEKAKLRNELIAYLEQLADDPEEIRAFAVAVASYSTLVDDGDTDVTCEMLRTMAQETEDMRVPYLDAGADR